MKNIKTYLIAIATAFSFASCGDSLLDIKPKDKFTTDVALSTIDGLEGAILGVYERGRNLIESNDVCVYRSCQTDLVMAGTNLNDQAVFRAILNMDYQFNGSNNGVRDIWNAYYIGINRANLIIEGVDNVKMDQTASNIAKRDQVLGEAYFFRAYYHHCLVTKWENIVLADKIDPAGTIFLSTPDQVYPLIISDLTKAIELLPEAVAINSSGRASKGVARHLLSKAYMDRGEWAKAAEMAEAVVKDPQYELLTDLTQIFSCTNQDNHEIIFAWQFSANDDGHPQRITQQWYPLYDRINGVSRSFQGGGRPWHRISPTPYYWTLFEPTDKRLDAYHKRFWTYDVNDSVNDPLAAGKAIGDTVRPGDFTASVDLGDRLIEPTTNKYFEDGSFGKSVEDAEGFRNIVQYRVAEAYLIAAEANWRAGNTSKGLEFLNAIRRRAGVSDYSTIDQDIILDESARELAHEGGRWELLKRMGVLVERVKAHSPEVGSNMQNYHVRWPIPRNFVDLTRVSQNEGYTE